MNCAGTERAAHASFNVFPVTRNMPGAATMRISMNIQEENSAHYFRVQSEHEQTLISNIRGYVDKIEWINHAIQLLLEEKLVKDDCLPFMVLFDASHLNNTEGLPALIALLPRQHCSNRCCCKAAGLSCTGLCQCGGQCEDN